MSDIADTDFYTAGSCFDDFLEEEGVLHEAETAARKKMIAFQTGHKPITEEDSQ